MKRLTLSFILLSFAFMVTAEPVSKQSALYTAQSYMMGKGKTVNTAQKPFKAARRSAVSSQGEEEAYYYVFNAGGNGGYVIVSGDDRVEPILGYVEQGSFDPETIPDNMRAWLDGYAEEIKYVIDNDINPNSSVLRRSKIKGTKHSIPEILTTRWNQGLPYNLTIEKYYKEICLLQQAYVKGEGEDVAAHVAAVSKAVGAPIAVKSYVRFEKGEGIEKRSDDLAAEVAKMVKG